MARHVALLRGINVGTAKSITMLDLAAVFETLGCEQVKTVLRSGNVVFSAGRPPASAAIEAAVLKATGVQSSVIVIGAKAFASIVAESPLLASIDNGSKAFVTFFSGPHGPVETPDAAALAPEIMTVTEHAVYQWIPDGLTQTKVTPAFWRQFKTPVTTRNWNTVQKLLTLLEAPK